MKTNLLKIACSTFVLMMNFGLHAQEVSVDDLFADNCSMSDKDPCAPPPVGCMQAEPLNNCCPFKPAYNAPSVVDVCHSPCWWWPTNIYLDLSFVYWQVAQEGLILGNGRLFNPGPGPVGGIAAGGVVLPKNSPALIQDKEFTPGFKIGLGFVAEHEWIVSTEYTWVRQNTSVNANAPSVSSSFGLPTLWNVAKWYQQQITAGGGLAASNVKSNWHVGMDFFDVTAGRPYYEGSMLSVSPRMGFRAAWIRQDLNLSVTVPSVLITSPAAGPYASNNHSSSWALGPRMELDTSCLLPMGFRLQGNCAANLLFTRYTEITHREDAISTVIGALQKNYTSKLPVYDCFRPSGEMGLGLGWSRYLCCNKYHIDFSATYDFAIFWQQNMLSGLLDQTNSFYSSWVGNVNGAAGNLFYNGLTLNGRFDF